MSVRKNSLNSDDPLDQLLAGSDDRTVFEMGGMRGSLKRVLTERVLDEKLGRQLSNRGFSRRLFARQAKPPPTAQGEDFHDQQTKN